MTDITSEEAVKVLSQKFLLTEGIVGISHGSDPLKVYVEDQSVAEKIPSTLMGHDVEVIVSGKIVALGTLPMAKTGRTLSGIEGSKSDRWRPAPGGCSIGHYNITAGTFGTVVYDRLTGSKLILSNSHVLAVSGTGIPGDPVYQPAPYDGGTEEDVIAYLERFVQFVTPPFTNKVDCAVARPLNPDIISDEILDIGVAPTEFESAREGMRIVKSGRTSCYTEGIVEDIHAVIKVSGYPQGELIFEDQIITSHIGDPGDSGSAVLNADTGRIVGLLFAGSDTLTVVNKIENVLDSLNVSLAPPIVDLSGIISILAGIAPLGLVASVVGFTELNNMGVLR